MVYFLLPLLYACFMMSGFVVSSERKGLCWGRYMLCLSACNHHQHWLSNFHCTYGRCCLISSSDIYKPLDAGQEWLGRKHWYPISGGGQLVFNTAPNSITSQSRKIPGTVTQDISVRTTMSLSSVGSFTSTDRPVVTTERDVLIFKDDRGNREWSFRFDASVKPGVKAANYCQKYAAITKELLHASPLLSNPRPFSIEVENCGPRYIPLVVGGTKTKSGEFPHMAAIGFLRNNEVEYLCGGSLISDSFVLTAAHCSSTRWGPPRVVHLGSDELYSENASVIDVESVIVHPKYRLPQVYNDLALIKLARGLKMSLILRPACLPSPRTKSEQPGSVAIATGWGKIGFGQESASDLMKVALRVAPNQACKNFYEGELSTANLPDGVIETMLCSGGHLSPSHDTCQGDSGGPLQAAVANSRCMFEIIGITSFGKSCGTGVPAVYTRVSSYVQWIEDTIWPEE